MLKSNLKPISIRNYWFSKVTFSQYRTFFKAIFFCIIVFIDHKEETQWCFFVVVLIFIFLSTSIFTENVKNWVFRSIFQHVSQIQIGFSLNGFRLGQENKLYKASNVCNWSLKISFLDIVRILDVFILSCRLVNFSPNWPQINLVPEVDLFQTYFAQRFSQHWRFYIRISNLDH